MKRLFTVQRLTPILIFAYLSFLLLPVSASFASCWQWSSSSGRRSIPFPSTDTRRKSTVVIETHASMKPDPPTSSTASLLPRRPPDMETQPRRRNNLATNETPNWRKGNNQNHKRQRGNSDPPRRRRDDSSGDHPAMLLPATIPRLSDLLNSLPPDRAATPTVPRHSRDGKPTSHHRRARQKGSTDPSDENLLVGEPWLADYHTSCHTQQRIKRAAESAAAGRSVDGPAVVLSTFFNTPPDRCNAANLVCALTSSAKLLNPRHCLSDRALQLFFQTTHVLDQMLDRRLLTARQLCNVAWAVAKYYERDPRVLPPPQTRAALSSDHVFGVAETWDLSQAGVAAASRRVDAVVDHLAERLRESLDRDARAAKEGELGMACWAYGVLRPRRRPPGWKHGPQVAAIGREHTVRQVPHREATDLVKFERWTTTLSDDSEDFDGGEPGTVTDALFDKIAQALVNPSRERSDPNGANSESSRIQACQWKELANLAWAFASRGRFRSSESQDLLLAIAEESANRLEQGGSHSQQVLSRDLSQIVWSLGVLQVDNFRLADGLVRVVDAVVEWTGVATTGVRLRSFRTWSCADIVQFVLSLAHARIDEGQLLRHLYEEAAWRLERDDDASNRETSHRMRFQTWEVSILLWCQARLYLKEPQGQVFERFASLAASVLAKRTRDVDRLTDVGFGYQEQANIVWSLTVLEANHEASTIHLIRRIFNEACRSCQEDGVIHLEHAHQLWQALYLLGKECPDAVSEVPQWFSAYLQDKWRAEKARPKVSSARHRALSQALTSMGVVHKNEHDEDIDVAIVLKPNAAWSHESLGREDAEAGTSDGVRLAVEFDGPNHFTRQRSKEGSSPAEVPRALGHTVLKYRLLKMQGWIVVRVPYYEFDKIPFWASMERQRYLQRLLKTHGNLRFSEADVSEYRPHVANRRSRFD